MNTPSLRPSRLSGSATLLVLAALGASPAGPTKNGPKPALTVVDRSVTLCQVVQQQPRSIRLCWQVDYRLRLDRATGLVVSPGDVSAVVEGWVSNSRAGGHGVPRLSRAAIDGASSPTAVAEVIASKDKAQRCLERVALRVWPEGGRGWEEVPEPPAESAAATAPPTAPAEPPPTFSIAPGGILCVRLRLEHQHDLYGPYDPLLGQRTLELHAGPFVLRDVLPLDHEHRLPRADCGWGQVPADRRDTSQFVSGPDSLHLEAHVPGNRSYRFPDRLVRYGAKMRLRYWYLVAPGTLGACKARLAQYKDTPTDWKVLDDGEIEECLSVVGRWVRVERVFRTESDATTVALEFQIAGAEEIGEFWVDDVSLEPIEEGSASP